MISTGTGKEILSEAGIMCSSSNLVFLVLLMSVALKSRLNQEASEVMNFSRVSNLCCHHSVCVPLDRYIVGSSLKNLT